MSSASSVLPHEAQCRPKSFICSSPAVPPTFPSDYPGDSSDGRTEQGRPQCDGGVILRPSGRPPGYLLVAGRRWRIRRAGELRRDSCLTSFSKGSMAWGGLFLSFVRPSPEQQKSCLAAASGFNYDAALHGASAPKSPAALTSEDTNRALADRGFSVNHSRVLIGSGTDTFLHAKSALLSWKHLALGWADVEPDTPVKVGTRFCICYKEVIPWVMFPLQIAYVTDNNNNNNNNNGFSMRNSAKGGGVFAFGSGTLQGHLLAGEERFSVQVDEEERVWYEVFSFSKPAHVLSALCYPYVQLRQRHFARESAKAMLRHIASSSTAPPQ